MEKREEAKTTLETKGQRKSCVVSRIHQLKLLRRRLPRHFAGLAGFESKWQEERNRLKEMFGSLDAPTTGLATQYWLAGTGYEIEVTWKVE
ncbi:hypothetical protein L3Y34_001300 [Caenorhabditis briggsae]|uniref:Uncharacterized protein n=1 Tax=Caenorhabditis briggsae TaxID=6238 RepID=A0AAE9IQE7_CAEBR|nr:hypothetical protein L3Y34_001300 [Caenorhabditis briggsae]